MSLSIKDLKEKEVFKPARPQNCPDNLKACDALLSKDPNHVSMLVLKGKLMIRLDRLSEAINCFDRVLSLKPDEYGCQ